jgi:hypothetical protein
MSDFNPEVVVARLKVQTVILRKKVYKRSRLDRYKGELLQLKHQGATTAELQRWLKDKRIKVVWTTVKRWLDNNG